MKDMGYCSAPSHALAAWLRPKTFGWPARRPSAKPILHGGVRVAIQRTGGALNCNGYGERKERQVMSRFIKIDDVINDERMQYFEDLLPDDLEFDEHTRLIGAVDDEGYAEGALVFRFNGWIVNLLYIGVYPELRRQGIGTGLIDTLMKYLVPVEFPIMVEAYYLLEDEDDPDNTADLFFRSLIDFEVVSGGKYCTVSAHTVWNSKRLQLLEGFDCSLKLFSELSRTEKSELLNYLRDNYMDVFVKVTIDEIIPELSLCHVENGKCTSFMIARKSGVKKTIELAFLQSRPGETDGLFGLLKEFIKRLKGLYPHHDLVFSLINKDSELMAKRFFSKDLKVSEIYTALSFGKLEETEEEESGSV